MTLEMMKALTSGGGFIALGLAALGSAYGCGAAVMAACGAWKKIYSQNKPAPFQLLVFCGLPLSQTIYGVVLFMLIHGKAETAAAFWPMFIFIGLFAGLALCASAWWQGRGAASACDAFAETGKGFANYIMVLGIIETVSLFALAFAIIALPNVSPETEAAMVQLRATPLPEVQQSAAQAADVQTP